MTPYEVAKAWLHAGFSVVPPRLDGSKAPLGEWKQFMHQRANDDQLFIWYNRTKQTGVGLVCGKISGNLEMLELEGRATNGASLDKIWDACGVFNIQHLWTALCDNYMERTPSGGIHFLYRIFEEDGNVPGNTKIARRPATPEELAENPQDKIKTLAETRGEGGYVIVAPSYGTVHPSGESWDMISGQPGAVLNMSMKERNALVVAIRTALDEMPEPEAPPAKPMRPPIPGEKRPGDDFAERVTWHDILLPHGWVPSAHRGPGDKVNWTRPGKSFGTSATTSESTGGMYVFSTSTEFETERPYSKFGAYAVLEHNGDFSAAASALARQGLGSRPDPYASGVLASPFQTEVWQQADELPVPVSPGTTAAVATKSALSIEQWNSAGVPEYQHGVFRYMPKWNGIEIGEMWARLHENTFRYVHSDKVWMRWNGKVWSRSEAELSYHCAGVMAKRLLAYAEHVEAENPEVGKALVKEARKTATAAGATAMLTVGRSDPAIGAIWGDFNKEKHMVALDNGVLNLESFELSDHDHRLMQTRQVAAAFDPEKKEGRFTRFMEEVLPDQEVREYLQRVCGYALTGQMGERAFMQLYGPSGSGKSQFIKALFSVMGDYAKTASESAFQTRPSNYKGPSEDQHQLMGARFVTHAELDEGFRLNVSLIKKLTGGESMTTRELYGKEVEWVPEYTVFMSTNHLPRVSAGEEAFWNRVKPIYFGQVFIDSEGQPLHPEDRNLGEKMARDEPEVILNWVLEGLKKYRERGLDAPEQIAQWRDEYREQVDSVHQFLHEAPEEGRVAVGSDKVVAVSQFYRIYAAWCTDNSIPALGMRKFNERMRDAGYRSERHSQGIFWHGIGVAGFVGEATTPIRGHGNWYQRE